MQQLVQLDYNTHNNTHNHTHTHNILYVAYSDDNMQQQVQQVQQGVAITRIIIMLTYAGVC
jgi:hypothetical protein